MLSEGLNIMHIKQIHPEIFNQVLRKFVVAQKAINRVLALCHLLDKLSNPKKCAQEPEMCTWALRLPRAFGRDEALNTSRQKFPNLFDNALCPYSLLKVFSNMTHML